MEVYAGELSVIFLLSYCFWLHLQQHEAISPPSDGNHSHRRTCAYTHSSWHNTCNILNLSDLQSASKDGILFECDFYQQTKLRLQNLLATFPTEMLERDDLPSLNVASRESQPLRLHGEFYLEEQLISQTKKGRPQAYCLFFLIFFLICFVF